MRYIFSTGVALLFAAALVSPAHSQARLKDGKANRELSDQVMKLVATGDMEAGIRLVKPYIIIPDSEMETMIGQAKLQAPMLEIRFGKPIGSEFISEDSVGENVMRIVQICRYERHLTRWNFFFYRTPTGWVLNTFNFDDKLQALF